MSARRARPIVNDLPLGNSSERPKRSACNRRSRLGKHRSDDPQIGRRSARTGRKNRRTRRRYPQAINLDTVDPICTGSGAGEEIAFFGIRRIGCNSFKCIPAHLAIAPTLLHRKIRFEHGTSRPKRLDAGLYPRPPCRRDFFRARWSAPVPLKIRHTDRQGAELHIDVIARAPTTYAFAPICKDFVFLSAECRPGSDCRHD